MAPADLVWRLTLTRILPAGFLLGVGLETFMYYTDFWATATRKHGEREDERAEALDALRSDRARRVESLLGSPEGSSPRGGGPPAPPPPAPLA